MSYVYKTMQSPVGCLKLVASRSGLAAILWPDDDPRRVRLGPLVEDQDDAILIETERQLSEYFAGTRTAFDLKLDVVGTDFQKQVWAALVRIPFGETRSYGDIARDLGNPKAVRAVGAANGEEPDLDRRALPPRDRRLGRADRFRWRPRGQGDAAGDRGQELRPGHHGEIARHRRRTARRRQGGRPAPVRWPVRRRDHAGPL